MYLYIATFPNGKKYVGITKDLKKRLHTHKSRAKLRRDFNRFFYNAINKYGWDSIQWEVADGYGDWDCLCDAEIQTIAALNTNDRSCGYNITIGGDGYNGLTHDDEWKKMMSERMSGENSPSWGRVLTDEEKRHLSEINTGENHPRYGKRITERQKEAMDAGYKRFCIKNGGGGMFGKKMPKSAIDKLSRDRIGAGNPMFGKRPPGSKLTEDQVKEIRSKYATGEYTYLDLAKEYGVGQTTISDIIKGRKYKRVK